MCVLCSINESMAPIAWKLTDRVVALYHEGFTVAQISEIMLLNDVTVGIWIEQHA